MGQAPSAVDGKAATQIAGTLWTALLGSGGAAVAEPAAKQQGQKLALTVALADGGTLQATYVKSADGKKAWLMFPPQKVSPAPGQLWQVPTVRWVVAPVVLGDALAKFLTGGAPKPDAAAAPAPAAAAAPTAAASAPGSIGGAAAAAGAAGAGRVSAASTPADKAASVAGPGLVALLLLALVAAPLAIAFVPDRWFAVLRPARSV